MPKSIETMKKLLLITLSVLAVLTSCKQEKTSADADGTTTLQFTSSTYERILRYEVPSDDAEGASDLSPLYSMATLRLMLPTSIGGEEPTDLLHAVIKTFFSDSVSTTLSDATERYLSQPLGMEEGTYINLCVVDSAESDYMQLSDHSADIHVKTLTTRWMVLECDAYEYFAGAAHPMTGSFYLNYDLQNNRLLTLDDIVTDRDHLALLLSQIYTQQRSGERPYGYSTTVAADGTFDIPVTDNFFLTSGGLSFVYQPYEIASYAEGIQTIRISFFELLDADILTSQFKDTDF